jgi:hypothetical protein
MRERKRDKVKCEHLADQEAKGLKAKQETRVSNKPESVGERLSHNNKQAV